MKTVLISLLAAAVSVLGSAADPDEENQIRAQIQRYLEAWNSGDAERLASFYTEDGDRANNRGDIFHGRDAILDHYKRVLLFHRRRMLSAGWSVITSTSESCQPRPRSLTSSMRLAVSVPR